MLTEIKNHSCVFESNFLNEKIFFFEVTENIFLLVRGLGSAKMYSRLLKEYRECLKSELLLVVWISDTITLQFPNSSDFRHCLKSEPKV